MSQSTHRPSRPGDGGGNGDKAAVIDAIMDAFAERTGLGSASAPARRYLWTDAFAVCNYLQRYCETNRGTYLQAALGLIDAVHRTLGRHRPGGRRRGWISGLTDKEARAHPTRGGLRIGKSMAERGPGEPLDERLEWERDGQYFHYLVKWMHALDCVARVTGEGQYNRWALELAKTAHAGFTYTLPGGQKRMYWKMSTNLSYPLVGSMGHHDPLDGLITFEQLTATASRFPDTPAELDLSREIADFRSMCAGRNWATDDALGLGGLLADALRLTQVIGEAGARAGPARVASLLRDARTGLDAFVRRAGLDDPADRRLAFRELGLSIGLHAVDRIRRIAARRPDDFSWPSGFQSMLGELAGFGPLCQKIEHFWLQPVHQESRAWRDHLDINAVMLATSLSPDGYLMLR